MNGATVPIIPFSNPWSAYSPLSGQNPFPPFSSPGNVPGSNATFAPPIYIQDGFAPNYTDGRTYTWNLSIEHLFASHWLAKAAYVGSESDHQSLAVDENYGQFFGAGNPANGTRLNPNFTTALIVSSPGTASYQSGQFSLQRNFANGLQFNANYTYAHTIDWYSTSTTAFTGSVPTRAAFLATKEIRRWTCLRRLTSTSSIQPLFSEGRELSMLFLAAGKLVASGVLIPELRRLSFPA